MPRVGSSVAGMMLSSPPLSEELCGPETFPTHFLLLHPSHPCPLFPSSPETTQSKSLILTMGEPFPAQCPRVRRGGVRPAACERAPPAEGLWACLRWAFMECFSVGTGKIGDDKHGHEVGDHPEDQGQDCQ